MKGIFDKAGVCVSSLCILHCASSLLLVLFVPAGFLSFFIGEEVHLLLAYIALFIGVFTFIPGYVAHRNLPLLFAGIIGLSFITIPHIFFEEYMNEFLEIATTLIAGSLLIFFHIMNRRLCMRCC